MKQEAEQLVPCLAARGDLLLTAGRAGLLSVFFVAAAFLPDAFLDGGSISLLLFADLPTLTTGLPWPATENAIT